MSNFDQLPYEPNLETTKFTAAASEDELQDFISLVRRSRLGPKTHENSAAEEREGLNKYGVTFDWMSKAKERWESGFNWRSIEQRVNKFPNFKTQVVDDDGSTFSVHFVGLFSQKKDAIPLMFIHGWPGSFLEFVGILESLQSKYSSENLPYHVIVPSLPGYAYSDKPPVDRDWTLQDSARLLNKLMIGLGFENGYAVQGGDIGSYTGRILAGSYDTCKALHLNFCAMTCPDESKHGVLPIEDHEKAGLERGDSFGKFGAAYAQEHMTRPSTIGFVLSSSPLALLGWIGEKFLTWTDTAPPVDEILASVTLYWLTDSFPTAIYPYRQEMVPPTDGPKSDAFYREVLQHGPERYMAHRDPKYYCNKPLGYSWFPAEIFPVPKSWAATTGKLVWSKHHQKGGHFAAMEQPDSLLADVEDFLKHHWA